MSQLDAFRALPGTSGAPLRRSSGQLRTAAMRLTLRLSVGVGIVTWCCLGQSVYAHTPPWLVDAHEAAKRTRATAPTPPSDVDHRDSPRVGFISRHRAPSATMRAERNATMATSSIPVSSASVGRNADSAASADNAAMEFDAFFSAYVLYWSN